MGNLNARRRRNRPQVLNNWLYLWGGSEDGHVRHKKPNIFLNEIIYILYVLIFYSC
jgi:hypothetical protein